MRVLFVCPFVPWPLDNGGKVRTFNLLKEASAHAEIHLRIVREPGEAEGAREALAPYCRTLRFYDRSPPGPIRRLFLPKLERWFHSKTLLEDLREELASGEYGLVHLDELLLARVVPRRSPVPVVQHHHKLDTVLYDTLRSNEGAQRHFDLWKLRRLESESTRRYRHHLLCSAEDAELLRSRYGALDVAVVPSGFDPEHFHPSNPPPERDDARLLFLGSMDYGPNVDAVLYFAEEVLPAIRAERPDVLLDVVGGAPSPEVRALESEGVRISGRASEVLSHFERAAVFVVPLRIGGGTRLKIVEALALATPIVSTTIGAEGLGLEDGRHLLLADDPSAFARATLRLLHDPEAARALGRTGKEYVDRRFPWPALAEELVDYWERVAFAGKRSPSR